MIATGMALSVIPVRPRTRKLCILIIPKRLRISLQKTLKTSNNAKV